VLSDPKHPLGEQNTQPASHKGVADLQAAVDGGALLRRQAASRLPALQRKQRACRLLRSSEPPLVPGDDGCHLQGALVRGLPSDSPHRSIRSGLWRIGEPEPSPSR
jgi:hypothetical protein